MTKVVNRGGGLIGEYGPIYSVDGNMQPKVIEKNDQLLN